MKKILSLILVAVMLLAAGCGNNDSVNTTPAGESKKAETNTTEQKTAAQVTVTGPADTMFVTEEPTETTTLESQNAQSIQEQISSGILALYTATSQDYDKIAVLAWIDPFTGDASLFRRFQVNKDTVQIYPFRTPYSGEYGKKYLRQSFDDNWERVVAEDSESASWGWMDTEGNYTDITGLLPDDSSVHRTLYGIGFYGGFYFFSDLEIPADLYTRYLEYVKGGITSDNAQQVLALISAIKENYEFIVYKIPVDDAVSGNLKPVETFFIESSLMWEDLYVGLARYFLIQSDGMTEKAFFYGGGNLAVNSVPVFLSGLSGVSIPMSYYGDWADEETAIVGRGTKSLIWCKGVDLNGEDGWEVRRKGGFPKEDGYIDIGKNENALSNTIVSPDHLSFACIEEAYEISLEVISLDLFGDEPDQTVTYSSGTPGKRVCLFSLDREDMSVNKLWTLDAGVVSVSGQQLELRRILDWTGEWSTEEAEARRPIQVGDIITFGSYPQDADGTVKSIEWQVLAVEDGKVLLISCYGLDAKPYNEEWTEVTWETCTLRTWLNEDFYQEAFSKDEQNKISLTNVENRDNEVFGTAGGNDTEDRIFLLSLDEVNTYFASDENRICYPTELAVKNGYYIGHNGACDWWLRSPGSDGRLAARVFFSGLVDEAGYHVDSFDHDVRPALWYNPNP